jgi:NADH:ubiquinone reductase (H+-translocating)
MVGTHRGRVEAAAVVGHLDRDGVVGRGDADRDPSLLDRGALNFVIVGAGATGTETAGALAEMIRDVMPHEYQDLAVRHARVVLVDLVHTVLGPFSDRAHEYAAKVLQRDGVELRLGTSVKEVGEDRVLLSDGTTIPTHCVIWGGGSWRRRRRPGPGSPRAAAGGSTSDTT